MALVGERTRSMRHFDSRVFEMRGKAIERCGIGHFPAEKPDPFAAVGIDDDALLAVVHAEGKRRARFVDALQAEQAGA